jgi:hypothetical protein
MSRECGMWFVHYHRSGIAGMLTLTSLELALEKACSLLGQGMDVSKIEGIAPLQGMSAEEIKLTAPGEG